jgi:hypothetical protein
LWSARRSRVTRLGEFSPFGVIWFSLGIFFNYWNNTNSLASFPSKQVRHYFLTTMGWASL